MKFSGRSFHGSFRRQGRSRLAGFQSATRGLQSCGSQAGDALPNRQPAPPTPRGRITAHLAMVGLPCELLALPLYFVFIWRSDVAPDFRGENSLLPVEPQDQYLQRQKKLAEIEARGHDAYPHKFDWTATPA